MKKLVTIWVTLAAAATVLGRPDPAEAAADRNTVQDWYGTPVLPSEYQDPTVPTLEEMLQGAPTAHPPATAPPLEKTESAFPRFLAVVDMDDWRRKDEVRSLRELAGDAFFGIPLIVPQLLMEEFIPTGIPIGPTAFLYRDRKDNRSMPLVVFDQAVFHEAQFLAQMQAMGGGTASDEVLTRSQRSVLRRSLMTGFRATYALPSMSLDLILETAAEYGAWAYALAPTAGAVLLYAKGIDQKFSIDDVVKGRVQITSGRDWIEASRSAGGMPAFNCEIRICDLPLALIVSLEMSDHGLYPQFIGLGTSLDVVEDLIGREESKGLRPGQ